MTLQVITVGGGRQGTALATLLLAGGHRVRMVEVQPAEVPRLEQELGAGVVVPGSGTDLAALETAGISQASVVAAVTGNDATNLVVTSLARFEYHVPRTIARVNDPRNAWMFTAAMGVDVALNPSDLMAHLIVEEMSLGDMMTLLKLRRGQYALVEEKIHHHAPAAGQAVRDLHLPAECVLTAVIRLGDLLIPRPDLVLQADDEVLALAHTSQTADLAALLSQRSPT